MNSIFVTVALVVLSIGCLAKFGRDLYYSRRVFAGSLSALFLKWGLSGDIYADDITGDPDSSEIVLASGDIEEMDYGQGAPAPHAVKRASQKKLASKGATLNATGGGKVVRADDFALGALFVTNAKLKQAGVKQKLQGRYFRTVVEQHVIRSPFEIVFGSGNGVADQNTFVDIEFDDTAKPDGCGIFGVPAIFGTISSSQNYAQAGSLYTIKLSGKTYEGNSLSEDTWTFERVDIMKPVTFIFIPYVKVKDLPIAALAGFGDIGGESENVSLTLSIKGMPLNESLKLTLPGIDSEDYQVFLSSLGIKL